MKMFCEFRLVLEGLFVLPLQRRENTVLPSFRRQVLAFLWLC